MAGAGFVAADFGGEIDWVDGSGGLQFGFVLQDGSGGGDGLQFFEVAVEKTFGAEAVGFDASEGFVGCVIEEGVASGCCCQFSFEAMASIDIPGGENELLELGLF